MTIVLVHGNPETAAIWDAMAPHLADPDVLRLSPPGFGAPVPAGFGCTMGDYRAWLAGELEDLDRPVDLIGHDWGCGHVMGVAVERPDLIRSWVVDGLGLFDPDYVWHDLAQVWQTPEAGEAAIAQMMGGPGEAVAERLTGLGLTPAAARSMAAARSPEMGQAILTLYRSAPEPVLRDFGGQIERAAARPGLGLIATEDHYCGGEVLARRTAKRAGAAVAVLEGAGHWWMCQQPEAGAEAINGFLEGLG